ncbi:MAG: hypothetical protein AAB502_01595, partial [Chloroflexota bacterium]
MTTSKVMEEPRFEFEDDYEAINNLFQAQKWTDGLPVVPPTDKAVARMVAASGRPGGEVIGKIAPRWAEATVEKVAGNAVMAGCLPE